jgi:glycerol-3-phosphate cytidylyltransferase
MVVGIATDEAVRYKIKHAIMKYEDIKAIIESLKYVDCVVPQKDTDKVNAWRTIKYDILLL